MIAAMNVFRVLFWTSEGLNVLFLCVIAVNHWLLYQQRKLLDEMFELNNELLGLLLVLRKTDEGEEWKRGE
jgi:hypothetical protein